MVIDVIIICLQNIVVATIFRLCHQTLSVSSIDLSIIMNEPPVEELNSFPDDCLPLEDSYESREALFAADLCMGGT